ncbi:hypothetical protein [Conchiformibius kuhniae]|uniref:Uncharacterized protein n=1 Tax=Conchiformibius kuhniae TaxID=211502 RepID=A0A8T9MUY0_9NEIS|nr:hypothetical protein [Conchiformibius kuhniae]UOP05001.1 hypothetical protein LVJ77_01355 [Conchiformibius kuhniae]
MNLIAGEAEWVFRNGESVQTDSRRVASDVYHDLSCFDLDSRIRGNDGAVFSRSSDDTLRAMCRNCCSRAL